MSHTKKVIYENINESFSIYTEKGYGRALILINKDNLRSPTLCLGFLFNLESNPYEPSRLIEVKNSTTYLDVVQHMKESLKTLDKSIIDFKEQIMKAELYIHELEKLQLKYSDKDRAFFKRIVSLVQ
jgi:hypothetical protein